MTIECYSVGRFREIIFNDFEDDTVRARSGLLDAEEAFDLADRLREIAQLLGQTSMADDNQAVLPFVLEEAPARFGRRATG